MASVARRVRNSAWTDLLIASNDLAIVQQLQEAIGARSVGVTRISPHLSAAREAFRERPFSALVLDLRLESGADEMANFLREIAARGMHRPAVFAIGDLGYDLAWAHLADQVIDARLSWPLDADQIAASIQNREPRLPEPVGSNDTQPWTREAGGRRYVAHTPSMRQTLDHLVMMATHDVTLLLVGETGTGKKTIARMIHDLSPRRDEPFVSMPCGSVPAADIESELFGCTYPSRLAARKGQHDAARTGHIEAAELGSLFLDEIDLLGPTQQAKLLRLIETGEYQSVGSSETRRSSARLIVASNVDLKSLMERSEFRADLYYRLNVLEFHLPPLRERPHDIVPMTLGFIDEFCKQHQVHIARIHPEFLEILKSYRWPGNIIELKNHIRRAVLFCRTEELSPGDLAPQLLAAVPASQPTEEHPRVAISLFEQVATTEQEILQDALRAHNFRRTATAQALGISRVGLYKKMKKYGMLTTSKETDAVANESHAERSLPIRKAVSRNLLKSPK